MCSRLASRMLFALSVLALATPLPALAQTDQLSGRIRSEDGRPVEGALAELHPVSDSTLTAYTLANDLGFFAFRDLEPGPYILRVARIGFREYREEVAVEGGATEVEVVMASQAIVAAGITVEAERSRAQTRFEESAGITVQEIGAADLKSRPEASRPRTVAGSPRG